MNDKVKDGDPRIYDAPQKREDSLPDIPTPPPGVIKAAFFTAIRYKSTQAAIKAYNSAVSELAGTKEAYARLAGAKLQHERAIRLLENAEEIHHQDAKRRRAETIRVDEEVVELEHQARLRQMERQRELRQFDSEPEPELSSVQAEFKEAVMDKVSVYHCRDMADNIVAEKTKGMSDEEREAFEKVIRAACDEAVRDMT